MDTTTAAHAARITRERQAHADAAAYTPADTITAAAYRVDPFEAGRHQARRTVAALLTEATEREARAHYRATARATA